MMQVFHDNLVKDAMLIPSSEISAQDINKLKIPQLANNFTFAGNDENLVIQFPSITNIKSFIVDTGNLSLNGTYILEGNETDNWVSPSFSENLIVTETALYLNTDLDYQYYRLKIIDVEVSIISLGYVQLGDKYLQLPPIDPSVKLDYNTTSEGSSSQSGLFYGNVGYRYLETEFNFPMITESEEIGFMTPFVAGRQEIKKMWDKVENVNPVWVFLWADNLDEHPPVFSIFNQKKLTMNKLPQDGKLWSTSLAVKQVY